jgi:hypothetical protein
MEALHGQEPTHPTPAQDAYDAELDRIVDTRGCSYTDATAQLAGAQLEAQMLAERARYAAPLLDIDDGVPVTNEFEATAMPEAAAIPGSTMTDAQAAQVLDLYLAVENADTRAKGWKDRLELGRAAFKISRPGAFDYEAPSGELRPMLTKEEAAAALGYIEKHTT